MADYYPPPGFAFLVSFDGIGASANDTLFQSVSGMDVTMETENIKEGGLNDFEHVLPVRATYSDLVLKRGLLTNSEVIQWALRAFQMDITPATITVKLMNDDRDKDGSLKNSLMQWNFVHAWPKKWSVAELNAEQNSVLIETLEIHYNYFTTG